MKESDISTTTMNLQAPAEAKGAVEKVSRSRFSSLLATKDRDYLLAPDGSQVCI